VTDVAIRPYDDADEDVVLGLLTASLGWLSDGEHRAFFRWKHLENPAGRSAMWVAESGGAIIGFRSMLRWRFIIDGVPATAVRAVDTATAPEARGLGVFRALTLHAVDELKADGVGFVFNTPNDQSRPGYLKMGWRELGRPPAVVRPHGLMGVARAAASRAPAELWSVSSNAGEPAAAVLGSDLPRTSAPSGVSTDRTADHLWWRYAGLPALDYRALRTDDGIAVFRLRRRGRATEAALCETLSVDSQGARRLIRAVARAAAADHVLFLGRPRPWVGELPVPGGGPVVTWRELTLTEPVPLGRWTLSLGDVELL